jgi:hypothetical protein
MYDFPVNRESSIVNQTLRCKGFIHDSRLTTHGYSFSSISTTFSRFKITKPIRSLLMPSLSW